MNRTQRTDVVASAIAFHIRTKGYEANKLTVEQIIGEASKFDSYGTMDKLWIKEIRDRHADYFAADTAYREQLYLPKDQRDDGLFLKLYTLEKQVTSWVRKVTRLTLQHVRDSTVTQD